MTAPIVMRCEGSGAASTYCQMCALPAPSGVVPEHERFDILAMLERGDFDNTWVSRLSGGRDHGD